MKANVYIKDSLVHLIYNDPNYDKHNKPVYLLGSNILEFAQTDLEEKNDEYDNLVWHAFALDMFHTEHFPEEKDRVAVAELYTEEEYNPYEFFHLKGFLDTIYHAIKKQDYDMTPYIEKVPEVKEIIAKINAREDYDAADKYAFIVKEILLAMLTRRINKIKKEIDFIVNILSVADEKAAKLTPMQRLYLLDLERKKNNEENEPYYTNSPFKTHFVPLLNGERVPENISSEDMKNIEVVEMYEIDGIDDLIRFELLKMVSNGVLVKKCENCGYYFVPAGRVDTVYCNRLYGDSDKTCAEIGSIKKYKDKVKDDPVYTAYNKAYKRNHSRVRNKKMTSDAFKRWKYEAMFMRDKCLDGDMTADEFMAWLAK